VRLGLVVPRYGEEVLGGTEHWLRTLLEHLVERFGWQAEVFTTCAASAETWADAYPAGAVELNGVTVNRYRSVSGRNPAYLDGYDAVRANPESLGDDKAMRHIELVGPVCPQAVDEAAASGCDLVAVTPYLYWPAVKGVARLGRRVVFHGAAHDEAELHLPIMKRVFRAVGGFSYNSYAERSLVESTFQVGHLPSAVIGNAVVESTGDPDLARRALGLGPDESFVVCVGRVERSKGSHILAEMWSTYRKRHPEAPRLVLIGPVQEPIASTPGVIVAGRRSEAEKWGALAAAEMLIAPSAWESFSLVVVESWLAGTPVLVNGRCGPTVEHCRRSGGGLWFDQYGDFEVAVDRVLANPALRKGLAQAGEEYVRSTFGWDVVTDRYAELTERILRTFPAKTPERRHL
jgi:glycosyltransferase involved in cell wall biosynthesis